MLILSARVITKPEQRDAFVQLALGMLAPSKAEAGCICYDCHQDINDPNVFLFFEKWQDQAALDAHFETPHFQNLAAQLPELLAEKASIMTYEVGATNVIS